MKTLRLRRPLLLELPGAPPTNGRVLLLPERERTQRDEG